MSAGAGGAAAAAAARRQREEEEEEEEMTTYSPQDLAEGWEFKILRSATGAFRNPQRLSQALEEEGKADWVLVEKFSDSRIRLKRPVSARNRDSTLDFDPYRTWVGLSETKLGLTILGAVLGTILLVVLIVIAVVNAAH